MASKRRTAIGVGAALFLVSLAFALALPMVVQLWGGTPGWIAPRYEMHGLGLVALLPVDAVLILTLIAYALALVVRQDWVALVDKLAMLILGLVMIGAGIWLILAGLAAFIGLVSLMLAFPFGTIAYFAEFTCGGTAPTPWYIAPVAGALEGKCFAGVSAISLIVTLLKLIALAVLLAASLGFLKVRGLIFAVALVSAMAIILMVVLWALSGLSFLLYPAEALTTAVLGLIAALYGLWTAVISFVALARAVAGQVM